MKRILLVLFVLVLVAAGAAVYTLTSSLDGLVKDAIQTHGSRMTGTAVRVGSVSVSLRDGSATLRNLRIANPEGFSDANALSLGELTLALDLRSLTEEPYVVKTLRVDAPEVNAEVNASGRSNIDVIRKRISAYSGAKPAAEQGPAAPSPRLRVLELRFENGVASADASAVGAGQRRVDLPPLTLSNLGGERGEPADRVARTVLEAYTKVVAKTVTRVLVGGRAEKLIDEKVGGELGEAAKGLLKNLLD